MSKIWNLGIDIDGTVTEPETFIPHLNKAFNKELRFDQITQFNLSPLYNISEEEFYIWLAENEGEIYASAPLAPFADQVLHDLFKIHQLIYISARHERHHSLTLQWFKKRKVPYHHITLIGSHDKIKTAKEHNIHLFFEDKLDNANDLAEELNIPIVLFNTPYNQGASHRNVYRVQDWNNAYQLLQVWMK